MDLEPRDITTPPRVSGVDLIDYLLGIAEFLADRDELQWTRPADVIDPAQSYTVSLDASPDGSVTRWTPSKESGLPTVIMLSQASRTTFLVRY